MDKPHSGGSQKDRRSRKLDGAGGQCGVVPPRQQGYCTDDDDDDVDDGDGDDDDVDDGDGDDGDGDDDDGDGGGDDGDDVDDGDDYDGDGDDDDDNDDDVMMIPDVHTLACCWNVAQPINNQLNLCCRKSCGPWSSVSTNVLTGSRRQRQGPPDVPESAPST